MRLSHFGPFLSYGPNFSQWAAQAKVGIVGYIKNKKKISPEDKKRTRRIPQAYFVVFSLYARVFYDNQKHFISQIISLDPGVTKRCVVYLD